jgi:hypothetical protein
MDVSGRVERSHILEMHPLIDIALIAALLIPPFAVADAWLSKRARRMREREEQVVLSEELRETVCR